MSGSDSPLGLYLHLALASERKRQMLDRDKLLVLAGVYAAAAGIHPVAALCRHKVLEHNRHHLIGHWPTVQSALEDEDFHMFIKQLDRRYPREKAELLLDELGIDLANERDTYLNEYEYAADLLGTTPDELDERFNERFDERFDGDFVTPPPVIDDVSVSVAGAGAGSTDQTAQSETLAQTDATPLGPPALFPLGLRIAVGTVVALIVGFAAGFSIAMLIYR